MANNVKANSFGVLLTLVEFVGKKPHRIPRAVSEVSLHQLVSWAKKETKVIVFDRNTCSLSVERWYRLMDLFFLAIFTINRAQYQVLTLEEYNLNVVVTLCNVSSIKG